MPIDKLHLHIYSSMYIVCILKGAGTSCALCPSQWYKANIIQRSVPISIECYSPPLTHPAQVVTGQLLPEGRQTPQCPPDAPPATAHHPPSQLLAGYPRLATTSHMTSPGCKKHYIRINSKHC